MKKYDFAVIGSGPAGQRAAVQAAKLGKRVAVIERREVVGGAVINTGTIPSKALREAAVYLTGASKRGLFGGAHYVKRKVTMDDLLSVTDRVMRNELQIVQDAFIRNDIDVVWGEARFESPHTLVVDRSENVCRISADKFLIATGSRPACPASIPFNKRTVFSSDTFVQMTPIPTSMIVVGGGVIGTEYACIMSTLGVRVTLVEARDKLLGPFVDEEIRESFQHEIRRMGITLRLGEKVEHLQEVPPNSGIGTVVEATLESGKKLRAGVLLYSVGRLGVCAELHLEKAGLKADGRHRLEVNEKYQTAVKHIYAAGDVIGFPALASTSMEQGRLAACHAFGKEARATGTLLPYGVYAVPEISMVGKTEEQLTEEGVPYEAGVALYRELARAQLLGDESGMLKLLIHQQDRTILGVHCIGAGATELIHIGQMIMTFNGPADVLLDNVFNYPTLAEAYKVAALNGVNKLTLV